MVIRKGGYTNKQKAYAMRVWGGDPKSKRKIATEVGYSQGVADHPKALIESTNGYKNAIKELADQSGAVAVAVFNELQTRDLSQVDFKELVNSVKIIADAWKIYNEPTEKAKESLQYKAILLQNVENQTIQANQQQQDKQAE